MVTAGDGVADVLDSALDASGYLAELRASDDPQDATRVENLAELHSVASDFQAANPDGTLADFLERVSLVADSDQLPPSADLEDEDARRAEEQGQITLMTVHTAKGLEFPVVFVTGMEDGTFPHARSLAEETELAEERRLAYVALTRARERLYLTRAAVRSAWGAANAMPASRFLDDVPGETIDWKRLTSSMEALRGGGTGWGSSWGEGGFGSGGQRSGGSRQGSYSGGYSDDDDFARPWGRCQALGQAGARGDRPGPGRQTGLYPSRGPWQAEHPLVGRERSRLGGPARGRGRAEGRRPGASRLLWGGHRRRPGGQGALPDRPRRVRHRRCPHHQAPYPALRPRGQDLTDQSLTLPRTALSAG
ncbi:UvrD-like helicase [Actinomyces naeslundii str. Howell 279]|uniref:UvrD-like helicase n=1 Tax=Actinomyces naeslundii (strain ATCC 12104 / DSM 43013 / CCUG 2238 / JCM 8349 / NCTC 10301 / Howell 279) TaxID=1115803 RepID=J3JK74_ACTNH|nr:UvrD-like helicase [Actinomyces naeslundii str. Howell 279]